MIGVEAQEAVKQSAQELLDTHFDLESLLGSDWKERCIFSDTKSAFSPEEFDAIENRREVTRETASTKAESWVADLDADFKAAGINYRAYAGEIGGKSNAVIVGFVGGDMVVITSRFEDSSYPGSEYLRHFGKVSATNFDIVSQSGGVFRVERLFREATDLTFDYSMAGGALLQDNTSYDGGKINAEMPRNTAQIGMFLHEAGHSLRIRRMSKQNQTIFNSYPSIRQDFSNASWENSIFDESTLPPFTTRKIAAADERSAWAICLSVMHEVGQSTDLDCGSHQALSTVMGTAEGCLATYDNMPYTLDGHPENEGIPAFSQQKRKLARQLHSELKDGGGTYQSISDQVEKVSHIIPNLKIKDG